MCAIIDDVGVIAETAAQGVRTRSAGEDVVAAVTGEGIGECFARAVDVSSASKEQVLDVGAYGIGDVALHSVAALIGILDRCHCHGRNRTPDDSVKCTDLDSICRIDITSDVSKLTQLSRVNRE